MESDAPQHAVKEISDSFLNNKIIVIGAGISGLSCAARLNHLGFKNVIILEGRDRVGGRTHTKYFGSNLIEMGAQWIHGKEGNSIFNLASSLGLINFSLPSYFDAVTNFSHITDEKEHKTILQVISFLEEISGDLKSQTSSCTDFISFLKYMNDNFQDFLSNSKANSHLKKLMVSCYRWYLNLSCELNGCCNLDALSNNLLSNYNECEGPQTIELRSGYFSILKTIMSSFPPDWIVLNKAVSLIDWTDFIESDAVNALSKNMVKLNLKCDETQCSVKVHCENSEVYVADHVIITIPLGCLKRNAKSLFVPELSITKIAAINSLGYDTVNKVYLEFENPFWNENAVYNNLCITESAFKLTSEENDSKTDVDDSWVNYINRFAYTPSHSNMLCAWVVGRGAEIMESLTDEKVTADSIKALESYSGKSVPKPLNMFRSTWKSDPYSCGSYSYLSTECEKKSLSHEDLAKPQYADASHGLKPILQFAGEATHSHFYSTVHGAYDTGIREADRLFHFYRSLTSLQPVIQWESNLFGMSNLTSLSKALTDNLKIVIIGAGISGLSCALRLSKFYFSNITILEAQGDVGGRVRTVNHGNSILELGAQWLHGSENTMYEYCSKHDLLDNLQVEGSYEGCGDFVTSSGQHVGEDVIADIRSFLDSVKTDIEAGLHSSDQSAETIFRNAFTSYTSKRNDNVVIKEIKKSFLEWYLLFEVIDNASTDLGQLSVQNYVDWAQASDDPYHINFKHGFRTMIDAMTSEIPSDTIKLNKHVKRVKWTPKFIHKPFTSLFSQNRSSTDFPVLLECEDGEVLSADCVMVTSSVGYLKSNMDTLFHPILPERKIKVYSCLGFGTIAKIYLVFEKPFWIKNDQGFQLLWSETELLEKNRTKWSSDPWVFGITGFDVVRRQPNVLLGWIGGTEAQMVESIDESKIGATCADVLREFLGEPNIPEPIRVLRSKWYSNNFIKGAYSNRTIEFYESGCTSFDLQEPLTSTYIKENGCQLQWPMVMFAGEHTDSCGFSSAHGAFQSGWREADRLIATCEDIMKTDDSD